MSAPTAADQVFEQPDLHPRGQIVEVSETGYFSSRTSWRPARVVARDGENCWLVAHDDCKCWVWDDEHGEMRPARLSTYLRYPVLRLMALGDKGARRLWHDLRFHLRWTPWRVLRVVHRALQHGRTKPSIPDPLTPGTMVVLQPVDQDGWLDGRAWLTTVMAMDDESITFSRMHGQMTRRPDGRLRQSSSGQLFIITTTVWQFEFEAALEQQRAVDAQLAAAAAEAEAQDEAEREQERATRAVLMTCPDCGEPGRYVGESDIPSDEYDVRTAAEWLETNEGLTVCDACGRRWWVMV